MEQFRSHLLALLVATVSLCIATNVKAQDSVERCTGLSVPVAIEQPFLDRFKLELAQLSGGDTSTVRELKRLLGYAEVKLQELRREALADSLVFARTVERMLEVDREAVSAQPELVTAWARFRLALIQSLWAGDCLGEAEELIAAARTWPITDPSVAVSVIVSHGGTLTKLGRLHEAIEALRPLLEAEGAPKTFTELRARFAALNNLTTALRQSGERTKAARVYRRILTLFTDSASTALVQTADARPTYELDIAILYLNLGALALYNQDTEETWTYLQKAHAALERAGQTESYAMVIWFRTAADYKKDIGDENSAREYLRKGLELAKRVVPNSKALHSQLSRRLQQIGVVDSTAIQKLLEYEKVLEGREDADWNAKVKSAEALSDAFSELRDWGRAVEWARIAYGRMQAVSAGPTVQLAMTQQKLSSALAHSWQNTKAYKQLAEAYEMSRAAARTVRGVGEREAIGCRVGQERNPKLIDVIREWHGVLSSILLQMPEIKRTPLEAEIANEVLGLVQAHETDRIGAATMQAAVRRRTANRDLAKNYEDWLKKKCALEEELSQLSAATHPDQASLASKFRRLAEIDNAVNAALSALPRSLAFALSRGREIFAVDELGELLRPGESMLAFRIGDQFSVASLVIRHGSKSTTVTVPLPNATFDGVKVAVSRILDAIEAGKPLGPQQELLSDMLRMEELQPLMVRFGVEHIFVVPDGHLRRLPSHLLPVGRARLGDLANSSIIASIWGFVWLRQVLPTTARSRVVFAIGDPELHHVPCQVIQQPEKTIHHEVMCLGKPGGLQGLLHGAQELLGGPAPVTGPEATREAMLGPVPQTAGILLFGTHGLIPEEKEISYLSEPALVLTPNQTDLEEDGLLLASQVAELLLDDSWLAILAACRTGTPSGTDVSNGLTGLALGFIAAGTDALLVTHWATYVDATREVVLSMLRRMAEDSELTLAAALDDAMHAYAKAHPKTRHWGGFSILGDGTVTMPPR